MKISLKILMFGFACILSGFIGCKKFLNVVPIDNLSGNNFWKTTGDFEGFTLDIYNQLRTVLMKNEMFFPATGDLRCAPTNVASGHSSEYFFGDLRKNDLGTMLARNDYKKDGSNKRPLWQITLWDNFYAIVQSANILDYETSQSTILTAEEKTKYGDEAKFLRSLTYFLMVRIYGDVPYYTEAFHSTPLPRTSMVDVLKKCAAELEGIKSSLPWSFDDQNVVGTRANRGAAIALLMHINMWLAGFDEGVDKSIYYQQTANLGKELMDDNGGAYGFVPLSQTYTIFKGHSRESLFEIVQNYNTNELFNSSSVYSFFCLKTPFTPESNTYFYYDQNFMLKIYPRDTSSDGRRTAWFDKNMYNADGTQQMFKFIDTTEKDITNPYAFQNQVVFRYTDAVLLRAEALSDLNKDDSARDIVNLVRQRAQATLFISAGDQLKDDIYWERVRELMGEGYYFYDLVRTRKLTDGNYCFAPITSAAFNNGAWTWPLDPTALDDNPYITLNQFWQ